MTLLYANENFPIQVVRELRRLGYGVLTSQEAGKANRAIPDDQVLSFALEQGRDLLTINRRDFRRLHRRSPHHAGLILCSQDPDVLGQAERIHRAIQQTGDLRGRELRINRPEK